MKTRAFLLVLPLAAIALGGCADNAASIEFQGICVPKGDCSFSGKCDSYVVVNPTLDSAVTQHMTMFFQLKNQLADNASTDLQRLNTNDANVEEAAIEYSGNAGLSGKVAFGLAGQVPAAGTAVVGVDVIPGFASGLNMTPPAYPVFLEAVAQVRLRGHYVDGSSFETAPFQVTIDVTTGAPQTRTCAGACPQVGQYPAGCP
jgi:hypothetical protein